MRITDFLKISPALGGFPTKCPWKISIFHLTSYDERSGGCGSPSGGPRHRHKEDCRNHLSKTYMNTPDRPQSEMVGCTAVRRLEFGPPVLRIYPGRRPAAITGQSFVRKAAFAVPPWPKPNCAIIGYPDWRKTPDREIEVRRLPSTEALMLLKSTYWISICEEIPYRRQFTDDVARCRLPPTMPPPCRQASRDACASKPHLQEFAVIRTAQERRNPSGPEPEGFRLNSERQTPLLVAVRAFQSFVTLLRLDRQSGDRTGIKAADPDRLLRFLAVTVGAILDPQKSGVDL